jgi:hypothetical protein
VVTTLAAVYGGYVSATATDPSGNTSEFCSDVTVASAIDVNLGSGATINEGSTYTGSGSFTGSGSSYTGTVNYGDGSGTQPLTLDPGNTFSLSHTYNTPGAYTLTVTITDNTGNVGTGTMPIYVLSAVPTVTSLSPTVGPTGGGTLVTVTGTNFNTATAVYFGGVAATSFTITSNTGLIATTPAQAAGTIDVTVENPAGTSALGSGDRFTYVAAPAPSVTSISPTSGPTAGGTAVVITGTNFAGAGQVDFGTLPAASFVVDSGTQITAVSPAQAAGTVDVTVTTPSGTSSTGSADRYTYTASSPPTVTGLSPTSGSTSGGTVVTITGTHFTGASAVAFGTIAVSGFTVLSDGIIVATTPAQAAGTVDVTVTTPSGTSVTGAADHFTYTAAPLPVVAGLSPASGPVTGGTAVTITGSGFTGATAVNFGSIAATAFTVLSDGAILASAPAAAPGTIDVTVTTPSGTSSTSSADHFTYTTASPPAVTGVSPASGNILGGTLVTITGSGFTGASEVDFGGNPASGLTVNSDSQITVTTPPHPAGTVDVQVVTPAGTSGPASGDRFTYTAGSPPTVTGLSPTGGSSAGGTSVTITGTGFTGASGVSFGGVPASSFTVTSPTSITAVSPPEAAGTVDVTVATPGGTSATGSGDQFTVTSAGAPAVTSLGTTGGSTAGGTLVGISGYGFTGASSVAFGTAGAASFTVVSDTLIIAVSPPHTAGTVDVTVTTPAGTSATGLADQFTYTAAGTPVIGGLSPSTGTTPGGNAVVITGSGFTGATAVSFGAVAAGFTVNADNSITAVAPPEAAGTVDVTVTTPSGTSSAVSADHYTYTNVSGPVPAVSGVSPATGSTAGGQAVTITGTGFTGATAVKFGTTAAAFTIVSDTTLTATAPAGSAGTVDVTVTTNNGTSPTSPPADQFTWLGTPAPSITSLSPGNGTTAGGTSVTITGTNFSGATAVLFGGVAAASFTVNSGTSITATSPALPAGSVGVTVTTPSGASNASTFTVTAASAPTVSGLGTTTGTTAGGTSVTITGTNFTGATAVYFGGVRASSFTVNSATSITAVSPPQSAGTYDITVAAYAGTSALSSADRFAYTVASVASVSGLGTTTGSTAGGTSVTITGSNFTGATAVMFGLVPAASFTVVSGTQITAVSPPQAAGTVDIIVTTYAGTSAAGSSDRFTYTAAAVPSVTSLGTGSGTTAGGTSVTVTGSGFTGATAVSFGAVAAASFTVVSDTQITAVSPPQAAGTVDVTVTTFAGTSAAGPADHFTYTAASAPSVGAVTPSSGSAAGGDTITVTGSGFTGATGVSFGGTPAGWFTVLSDTALLAASPAGSAGTLDVTVTTFAGTSATVSADHYTYSAVTAPSVTSLNPSTAGTGGGTSVTISGSGFTGADGVFFGGVPAASFAVASDGTIVAVAPPMTAVTIDITVTHAGTTSALGGADRFSATAPLAPAPAVSGLGTTGGSTAGGTSVTISGSQFTGANGVFFGAVPAAGWVFNSDGSITAVSPPEAAGTVDVTVSTPTGTSAVSSSDQFTYTAAPAPTVTGLGVSGGSTAGGLGVTVTGSNFTGATGVSFGTVAAAGFTVLSDGALVAWSPPQAAGTVDITVTTPSGTSSTGSADRFTYTAAAVPSVSSVTPSSGSATGGGTVTILGSGFTAATAVTFGTTAAAGFTVLSDSALVATAPAGSVGTVDITVTTPSGTSATGSADHYTYTAAPAAPSVSGVSPTSGSTGGGTVVIVTGSGFTGATAVSFGGVAATAFFVNSDTQLTVVAPSQAAATVDVTVTTPSGTSSAVSGDHYTYTAAPAPSVSGVSPGSGPPAGGGYVTLSGSNFSGATAVSFGGTAALGFTVVSDGTIFAQVPAEGAGTVDITVTTPSGTSSTGSADHYTYASDAALTSVAGSNFTTQTGTVINTIVATFADTDTSGMASQFTTVIDWGNGQYSQGTVLSNGTNGQGQPQFRVQGTGATYGTAGSYTVTTYITDVGGATATATATATVMQGPHSPTRPAPLAKGTTATATHGVAFKGSVASFVGSIPGGTAASYTATIDWGDGHKTAGTILATGANTFGVVGSNTYAKAGTYTVSITVTDSSGTSTTVTTTITVAQADDSDVPADDDPSRPLLAALLPPTTGEEDTADVSDDDLLGAAWWDGDAWLAAPPAEADSASEELVPAADRGESAEATHGSDAQFAAVYEVTTAPVTGVLPERSGEGDEAQIPADPGGEGLAAALVALLDDLFAGP